VVSSSLPAANTFSDKKSDRNIAKIVFIDVYLY